MIFNLWAWKVSQPGLAPYSRDPHIFGNNLQGVLKSGGRNIKDADTDDVWTISAQFLKSNVVIMILCK